MDSPPSIGPFFVDARGSLVVGEIAAGFSPLPLSRRRAGAGDALARFFFKLSVTHWR